MRDRTVGPCAMLGMVVVLSAAWFDGRTSEAAEKKPLPSFDDVKAAVGRHFQRLPGYQPGDIISQNEVQPLSLQLRRMGWTVADWKDILNKIPPDNDYLIRLLRTKKGKKFMRKISATPGTYDRLERLAGLPHGRMMVEKLLERKGGAEVIEYFADTPDGKKANRLMSKSSKGGVNYDQPTGRIYTAEMLLEHLNTSYEEAQKARAKETPKKNRR